MNNSAETAARETAQYFDKLIKDQIGRMGELERLSIKHFLETGAINGSFRQRLVTMLILLDIKHKTELSKVLAGHAYATTWIKVTPETMPEVDETDEWNWTKKISKDVWCWCEFGMKRGRYYHDVDIWTVDGASSSNGIKVTHWMPLPTPPAE